MTNQQHSITPPPEVVDRLFMIEGSEEDRIIASYRAGADQELEACCEWLGDAPVVYNDNGDLHPGSYLRDNRRPKPPSLKEQALAVLDHTQKGYGLAEVDLDTIRRALEALDD
jgi:hypothetical protein